MESSVLRVCVGVLAFALVLHLSSASSGSPPPSRRGSAAPPRSKLPSARAADLRDAMPARSPGGGLAPGTSSASARATALKAKLQAELPAEAYAPECLYTNRDGDVFRAASSSAAGHVNLVGLNGENVENIPMGGDATYTLHLYGDLPANAEAKAHEAFERIAKEVHAAPKGADLRGGAAYYRGCHSIGECLAIIQSLTAGGYPATGEVESLPTAEQIGHQVGNAEADTGKYPCTRHNPRNIVEYTENRAMASQAFNRGGYVGIKVDPTHVVRCSTIESGWCMRLRTPIQLVDVAFKGGASRHAAVATSLGTVLEQQQQQHPAQSPPTSRKSSLSSPSPSSPGSPKASSTPVAPVARATSPTSKKTPK